MAICNPQRADFYIHTVFVLYVCAVPDGGGKDPLMMLMLIIIIIIIIIIQSFSKSAIPRCARGAVQNKNRNRSRRDKSHQSAVR